MNKDITYPIKAVSQQTGLSTHVIRAWEKRYNAISPIRTETNRRLYSDSDIEKLSLLKELTESGYNIGNIAGYSIESLYKLVEKNFPSKDYNNVSLETDPKIHLNKCLEAITQFHSKELENVVMNASVALSKPDLFEKVIIPLAYEVGDRWKSGEMRIFQEHMFSNVIKSYLLGVIDSNNSPSGHNLVITTPQGQVHEIGALLAGSYAAIEGWNVSYLGPNLPTEEIIAAAIKLRSKVIALSIIYPPDHFELKQELRKYRELLPKDMFLIVGGKGAEIHLEDLIRIRSTYVKDFQEFLTALDEVKKSFI